MALMLLVLLQWNSQRGIQSVEDKLKIVTDNIDYAVVLTLMTFQMKKTEIHIVVLQLRTPCHLKFQKIEEVCEFKFIGMLRVQRSTTCDLLASVGSCVEFCFPKMFHVWCDWLETVQILGPGLKHRGKGHAGLRSETEPDDFE